MKRYGKKKDIFILIISVFIVSLVVSCGNSTRKPESVAEKTLQAIYHEQTVEAIVEKIQQDIYLELTAEAKKDAKNADKKNQIVSITPVVTSIPTIYQSVRNDLGIDVQDVVDYFYNFGINFNVNATQDRAILYSGMYGEAYQIHLLTRDGEFVEATIRIFMNFTELDDNGPGLGDLVISIFGKPYYEKLVKPWLISPHISGDCLCLDGVIYWYSDLSQTRANESILSLQIIPAGIADDYYNCCQ